MLGRSLSFLVAQKRTDMTSVSLPSTLTFSHRWVGAYTIVQLPSEVEIFSESNISSEPDDPVTLPATKVAQSKGEGC